MKDIKSFCDALDTWAQLRIKSYAQDEAVFGKNGFEESWRDVRLQISKSCLLSRTLYAGEGLSQTPCPVHEGKWAGIHCGWPGQKWSNDTPMEEDPQLREWYDAGCRCYMHKCGCTTGWQPDDRCGCGVKT